ncbi:heme lyase CcmF/NrfE family subunit [Tepidamorphus sp. 3E244]|uniref:heme lyase CcmF/NrfE family subunit n=1 Tax=Tepidamorphus sp. 3E244 TaxID=3385498 RepID=UPI0038FCC4C7
MIPETGHFALILAFVLALVQGVLPLYGVRRGDVAMMQTARTAALAQFVFVGAAFACLTLAYVQSDFSVINVYQNSHTAKPLIFKISGVWGNHEGSMVLWVLILTIFGAAVALFGSNIPEALRATALAVQGWISVAFLAFILVTSNPFLRLNPAPGEGRDLNPILQDVGLAIHPPLLYMGYVGFSIAFSFAVAALILGRVDAAWARWVRPWTLAAWMFLTLGIAVGSYWAYYELGWGGWWFWDPVENASFMPWLAGGALLHSAIVMEKREALKIWTILLAVLTFSLSLLGTFLVRSGVLTSVHSFASDPQRGLFILMILMFFTGGALALFAWRAPKLRPGGLFAPMSREGALVFNNLMLTAACGAVFVGTLYPLALEAVTNGEVKISVGPPFFNKTFGPLMVPLLLAVPFGPMLAWKRADALAAAQRLALAAGLAVVGGLALGWYATGTVPVAALGLMLGVWLIAGAASEIAFRTKLGRVAASETWRRMVNLPASAWGTATAHAGVGVTVIGVVAVTAFQGEAVKVLQPGESLEVSGYNVTFEGAVPREGPNYRDIVGQFTVRSGGSVVATTEPAKRVYTAKNQPTTEAGIITFGFSQLYVTLGDPQDGGGFAVTVHYKPLVTLIWLGALVMFFGGAMSLSDRRLRVGAPQRAKMQAVPAE